MIFNVISLILGILMLLLGRVLIKYKHGEMVLQILSVVMLLYKTISYVMLNVTGQISIPVEILSISYFMVSIIMTFRIVKFYNLASFFGLSAGIGFFLFYIVAGFTVESNFSMADFVISNLSHGYLFVVGMYLLAKNDFRKSNKLSIWVTILAMLFWALLFYDVQQRGITFVYYLIKPTYLFVFSDLFLNILVMILFYAVVVVLFYLWTKIFYKINQKLVVAQCEQNELNLKKLGNL